MNMQQNHLEDLHRLLGPTPETHTSGLGWGLRIYISSQFPGGSDLPPGPHFGNQCKQGTCETESV